MLRTNSQRPSLVAIRNFRGPKACSTALFSSPDKRFSVSSQPTWAAALQRAYDAPQPVDVVGFGQAMVDFSSSVDDRMLSQLNVPKGGRRVITAHERTEVLNTFDETERPYEINSGGSLANTLVAMARLSTATNALRNRAPISIAMAGSIGNDPLGEFFVSKMHHAGVRVIPDCQASTHTGTVMVLTTADAQRSFLSFFSSETMQVPPAVHAPLASSRLVVIEGYLWEQPGAQAAVHEILVNARACGALVAMTAGDVGVVTRHRKEMLAALAAGVDMLLTNSGEAAELLSNPDITAVDAAKQLAGSCPIVVVTDGSKGAHVTALGQLHTIPPCWTATAPVDTCGAGDAYAGGFLYAVLAGYDFRTAGEFAARVASCVIQRVGPQLVDEDAKKLAAILPLLSARSTCTQQHTYAMAPVPAV